MHITHARLITMHGCQQHARRVVARAMHAYYGCMMGMHTMHAYYDIAGMHGTVGALPGPQWSCLAVIVIVIIFIASTVRS